MDYGWKQLQETTGISNFHSQVLQSGNANSERFDDLPKVSPLERDLELHFPVWEPSATCGHSSLN